MSAAPKLLNLFVRTLAKPIANTIKHQSKVHPQFRRWCVDLAQKKHRWEVKLRTNLLGEPTPNVRPLSEARAIDSGANAIAEGFLFSVAALLIIGESWRSSRSLAKRREIVDEKIDELNQRIDMLSESVGALERRFEREWVVEKERNDELTRVLNRIVDIGLRGGWAQLEDTPLRLAKPSPPPPPPPPPPPSFPITSTKDSDNSRSSRLESSHQPQEELDDHDTHRQNVKSDSVSEKTFPYEEHRNIRKNSY